MRRLVVTEGALAGQAFEIEAEVVLGREGTDFVLKDPELSRRHAALRPTDDGIEIQDLGSTNGTFVNGRRIEAATRLGAGDTVRVGGTLLAVEVEGLAGATVIASGVTVAAPAAEPTRQVVAEAPPTAPVAAAPVPQPPPVAAAPVPSGPPAGAFAAPAGRPRGAAATRLYGPALLTLATILAVGVALVVYFAVR